MSYSQKVVSGGWIPVPQEMMDATGISEEDILATKQWGKVVPMMRKIGDYVLSTYLAEDPRKAMIMRWKARYCNGPNKKQKENMISPIVGFIYMIDSFKNHRGPDELGQERNHWRKRLLAQINCKTTWKRAHTALAKIIHNRMNMADSNPGKQQMWMMREIYRRPDVPWSVADYGNLGYPDDEDEGTSLIDPSGEATLEKIESEKPTIVNKKPKPKLLEVPPAPAPPPPPPGAVPLQHAIIAKDAEGNYPDPAAGPSGDDDDDDEMFDAVGPSYDSDSDSGDEVAVTSYPSSKPPGQPPSAAAFVMRPDDISSDDDMVDAEPPPYSAPPPPPKKPTRITTDGYKEEDEKPGPVNATVSDYPGTPPSGPAPGNVIAAVQVPSVGEVIGDDLMVSPPPYPPPTPPSAPAAVTSSSSPPNPPPDPLTIPSSAAPPPPDQPPSAEAIQDYPYPDPDDELPNLAFLFNDGVPPPPKPPATESVRIAELEDEIKQLKEKLALKEGEVVLMRSEKEEIDSDRAKLQEKLEEQKTLLNRRSAEIVLYDKRLKEWAAEKELMEKKRAEIEKELSDMRDKLAEQELEYEEHKKGLQKNVADLQAERDALEARRKQIESENASLLSNFKSLQEQNTKLSEEISNSDQNRQDLEEFRQKAIELDKRIRELTSKLQSSDSERERAASELKATKQKLKLAEEAEKNFTKEKKRIFKKHQEALEAKENELTQSFSEQIAGLTKELEKRKKDYKILEGNKQAKDKEVGNLQKQIEELEKQQRLAEQRLEQEKQLAHERGVKDATEKMEADILKLRKTIKQLEEENGKLKNEITELRQELDILKSQYSDLVKSTTDVRAELQRIFSTSQSDKVKELEGVITTMQQNAAAQVKSWEEALNTANQEKIALSGSLVSLQSEYMKSVADLNNQYEAAKKSLEQREQQVNQQLLTVDSRCKELEAQRQQLEVQRQANEATAKNLQELQSRPSPISAQAQRNSELLRKFQLSIAKIGEKFGYSGTVAEQDYDVVLADIVKQVDDLKKSYSDTMQQFEEAKNSVLAEQSRARALDQALAQSRSQVSTLTSALTALQSAQPATAEQKQTISDLRSQLTEQTNIARQQAERLEQLNTQRMKENKEYSDAVSQLTLSNDDLKKQVAALKETNESLQSKLTEAEDDYEDMRVAFNEANGKRQELERQLGELKETKRGIDDAAQDQLDALKQQYEEKYAKLQARVEAWKKEREQQTSELDSLEQENIRLLSKISLLTDELERQRSIDKKQTEQIIQLQENMKLLQEQLDLMENAALAERSHKRRRMGESPDMMQDSGTVDENRTQRTLGKLAAKASQEGVDVMVNSGSVMIRDPITNEQTYILVIKGKDKTGTPKDLLLWVKYDQKNRPVRGFFTDARGKWKIDEREWRNNGIPYDGWISLQQKLIEDKIQPDGILAPPNRAFINDKMDAKGTISADLTAAKKFTEDVENGIKSEKQDITENNAQLEKIQQLNNNDQLVVIDPAEIFDIFKGFAEAKNPRYAGVLESILKQIQRFVEKEVVEKKLGDGALVNFVSDPNYVPEDRILEINQVIKGMTPRNAWKTVWNNLIGHVRNINAKYMPAGFKHWMRIFHQRYKETLGGDENKGFDPRVVIELDPKLIYHTIASLVHDMLHAGPESSLITGFGYPTGTVPIPTVRGYQDTSNLYDYYGYGFNPFLKKLHNPPSYYVSDYYRY